MNQQELIDLTNEDVPREVIDLTEEETTYTTEPVYSMLLTYPRIKDQFERNGIELTAEGKVQYMVDTHLCQVDSIKDFFLIQLLQTDPQPVQVVVAMEDHKDGQPHIHCFVQYLKKSSYRSDYFDFGGVHPNILKCNKPLAALRYCLKEDNAPLRWVMTLTIDSDDEGFFPPSPPPEYQE